MYTSSVYYYNTQCILLIGTTACLGNGSQMLLHIFQFQFSLDLLCKLWGYFYILKFIVFSIWPENHSHLSRLCAVNQILGLSSKPGPLINWVSGHVSIITSTHARMMRGVRDQTISHLSLWWWCRHHANIIEIDEDYSFEDHQSIICSTTSHYKWLDNS